MQSLEKSLKLEAPDTTEEVGDGRSENEGSGSVDIPVREVRSLLPAPTSFDQVIRFFQAWRKTASLVLEKLNRDSG